MGKTIMISSHILSELEEICDNVGIIEHGKLVFSGTMDQIKQRMGLHAKVKVEVVSDPERAVELLVVLPKIEEVVADGRSLSVTFSDGHENDGFLARTLVQANIDIVSIEPQKLKLDDAFLQLTQGLVH